MQTASSPLDATKSYTVVLYVCVVTKHTVHDALFVHVCVSLCVNQTESLPLWCGKLNQSPLGVRMNRHTLLTQKLHMCVF